MHVVDLGSTFGSERERVRTYAMEPVHGERSLAVLQSGEPPSARDREPGKLRLYTTTPNRRPPSPSNDVRFFEDDHETIKASAVKDVNRRLRQGVDAFLMLGLPSATRMCWDDHRRHWLQLNGIRLADRAVGYVP